jgi:hypothetical protein
MGEKGGEWGKRKAASFSRRVPLWEIELNLATALQEEKHGKAAEESAGGLWNGLGREDADIGGVVDSNS